VGIPRAGRSRLARAALRPVPADRPDPRSFDPRDGAGTFRLGSGRQLASGDDWSFLTRRLQASTEGGSATSRMARRRRRSSRQLSARASWRIAAARDRRPRDNDAGERLGEPTRQSAGRRRSEPRGSRPARPRRRAAGRRSPGWVHLLTMNGAKRGADRVSSGTPTALSRTSCPQVGPTTRPARRVRAWVHVLRARGVGYLGRFGPLQARGPAAVRPQHADAVVELSVRSPVRARGHRGVLSYPYSHWRTYPYQHYDIHDYDSNLNSGSTRRLTRSASGRSSRGCSSGAEVAWKGRRRSRHPRPPLMAAAPGVSTLTSCLLHGFAR